jgi:hypothetical protein
MQIHSVQDASLAIRCHVARLSITIQRPNSGIRHHRRPNPRSPPIHPIMRPILLRALRRLGISFDSLPPKWVIAELAVYHLNYEHIRRLQTSGNEPRILQQRLKQRPRLAWASSWALLSLEMITIINSREYSCIFHSRDQLSSPKTILVLMICRHLSSLTPFF